MNASRPRIRLNKLLYLLLLAAIALPGLISQAQSATSLSQVHKIYVEPFTGKRGASEIRDNVIGQLKHDPSLTLVPTADQADALLKGRAAALPTSGESAFRR